MNRESVVSASPSGDQELSTHAIAHIVQGVSRASFRVPYHADLDAMHESHLGGKISHQELRHQLDAFFADKGVDLHTYQDKLAKQCEVLAADDLLVNQKIDGYQQAEQLMQFLADPNGFTVLHQLIEQGLAHVPPHEKLQWLDQTDATLSKMRSLLTTLRYVALHHAEADEHADLHQIFDEHHERLTAVHAHVRTNIRDLGRYRVVDQHDPEITKTGKHMKLAAENWRNFAPTKAPGTPNQTVVLIHGDNKALSPSQRALHEQGFRRLMVKMQSTVTHDSTQSIRSVEK